MRVFTVIGVIFVLWLVIVIVSQSGGQTPAAPQTPEQRAQAAKLKEMRIAREKETRKRRLVYDAQERVTKAMRDPESVTFGTVFYSNKAGETVCGMVNAKNGFGGFSGMQPFVIFVKGGRMALNDASAWNKHCAGAR